VVVFVGDVQLIVKAAGYNVTRLSHSLDRNDCNFVERESVVYLYRERLIKDDEQFVVNLGHTSYYSTYTTRTHGIQNTQLLDPFVYGTPERI